MKTSNLNIRKFISFDQYLCGICLFALIICSCQKSGNRKCFKSLGKIKIETRDATRFDFIYLYDNINLILTQDTFHSIKIEAPENLINFVKTDFSGKELTIKNENKCNFLRSYKYEINVYASFVNLENIYFMGAGKISSTNTIKTSQLILNLWDASGSLDLSVETILSRCNMHTGPGDIKLKGLAATSFFYSNGNGFMHLEDFVCQYSNVQNKGTGDFFVNVQKEMSVIITSTGSVFYTGNPIITNSETTGKGELLKIQ